MLQSKEAYLACLNQTPTQCQTLKEEYEANLQAYNSLTRNSPRQVEVEGMILH